MTSFVTVTGWLTIVLSIGVMVLYLSYFMDGILTFISTKYYGKKLSLELLELYLWLDKHRPEVVEKYTSKKNFFYDWLFIFLTLHYLKKYGN